MKRSQINEIMTEADEMIRSHGFVLPPFAYWSPEDFMARRDSARAVITARCGWDITDYGAGRYDEMGLFLFTLRNGRLADLQRGGGMCYAEKLLISKQDQFSPMHTHVIKAEDIINGESVTLMPGDLHAFWGEGGDVLIGEVSTVNDDETDNVFREPIGRFSTVEEDVTPMHLLVSDYARWLD